MRSSRRGSVITTLFIIALVMMVAFSMTVMAFQHWTFGQGRHNRQVARNLAESAAALAVARLTESPAYGVDRLFTDTVSLTDPEDPNSFAAVTFSPTRALEFKMRSSFNNQSDDAVPGTEIQIPPRTAQVLARARFRGEVYDAEVLMFVPPYPYVVVASGPLVIRGAFVATGVSNAGDWTGSIDTMPRAKQNMVTVASNNSTSESVSLGGRSDINGDLTSVGAIHIDPGGKVRGAVRAHTDAAPMPDLSVEEYQEKTTTGTQRRLGTAVSDATTGDMTVEWLVRCDGGLEINGDLIMEGGTLSVAGDLTVRGSIKGKGNVVVGGTTRVEGGTTLTADGVVAILCKGDVFLRGASKADSVLQGIVYSEGNVFASNLTVVGTLITNSAEGKGGVTLDEVNMIGAPVALGVRGGLVCHPGTDDDLVVFSAFAYPRPGDRTGRDLRYRLIAKKYTDEYGAPFITPLGVADNLTRQQAYDLIMKWDRETTPGMKGSAGGSILSREERKGSHTKVKEYFDALEKGPKKHELILNMDPNKLLRPAQVPRILMWRPRS